MNHDLTAREQTLLERIGAGKRNKEIASELAISENTVETHLKTIFKKLGVRNRVEAMQCCDHGLSGAVGQ